MDSQQLLVIVLATLVGVLYLLKIRSLDMYEKEPFLKLLIVFILGGISSIIVATILYEFVDVELNFLDAIIKIGLIEELSKLLTLIILVKYIKKDFNEISDGIVYISAIALGFAVIENIFYSFGANNSLLLLFQRSIFAVLGHVSFAGYMGLAYYIHVRVHKNYLGLAISIIIAALAHGLYDGVLFEEELNITFNVVFILLVVMQYRLFKIILGFSKFRKKMSKDIFKKTGKNSQIYCCKCNLESESEEYEFNHIKTAYCKKCGNAILDSNSFIDTLRYFRPVLKRRKFLKTFDYSKSIIFLDKDEKILLDTKRSLLSSNIDDLAIWLAESNEKDEQNILKIPILGFLIKMLGIRYVSS